MNQALAAESELRALDQGSWGNLLVVDWVVTTTQLALIVDAATRLASRNREVRATRLMAVKGLSCPPASSFTPTPAVSA